MSDLQKELDDLRALHAEVSGRNVTLHTENLKLRALCEALVETLQNIRDVTPKKGSVHLWAEIILAKAREMGFK